MKRLTYQNQKFLAEDDESVLDCLLRNRQAISHSCRSGICQSCLVNLKFGTPDLKAQLGLSPDQKERGVILSCQQKVQGDMEVTLNDLGRNFSEAVIESQNMLSPSVVEIGLKLTNKDFNFMPGQFVNLERFDGLIRPYSISNNDRSKSIHLHVRKIPEGKMSSWLFDSSVVGEKLNVYGPLGKCYYTKDLETEDLLLAAVGTGLAPVFGLVQDALENKHLGNIHLVHGARDLEGLYLRSELKKLEQENKNFKYSTCVLEDTKEEAEVYKGDIVNFVNKMELNSKMTAFICGDAQIVNKLKQTVFLKGLNSKKILSDPFILASSY